MLSEQKIAARLMLGDAKAEQEFQDLFRPRLHRACLQLLDNEDAEAAAAVRETFVLAMPRLNRFNFQTPLYGFLRSICVARCYTRLRRSGRMLDTQEQELELYIRYVAAERLDCHDPALLKNLRATLVEGLKSRMSGESRRILNMRDLQGYSYAQIGHALGIPLGSVMARLGRAREKLRHLIENISLDGLPDLRPKIAKQRE